MVLDWREHTNEIQERFFRCGIGTYLIIHVEEEEALASGDPVLGLSQEFNRLHRGESGVSACRYQVRWNFMFLDYGMCHSIGGTHLVERREVLEGARRGEDGVRYYIDEQFNGGGLDEREARHAVFGGHYDIYMAELDAMVNESAGEEGDA